MIDKTVEARRELCLVVFEVVDAASFGHGDTEDEVFAYHRLGILQVVLLTLPSEGGHLEAPVAHVEDLARIAETHHGAELLEEVLSFVLLDAGLHPARVEGRDVEALASALDGAEHAVGVVADQDEEGLGIRLLDDFEQLVRRRLVDLFGQPDNHDALVALEGFGGEDADDAGGLGLVDLGVLAFVADVLHPVGVGHVGASQQYVAPLGNVVETDGRIVARLAFPVDHREGEVEVGVLQLMDLQAVGTLFAGLAVGSMVFAKNVLGSRQGQRHGSRAFATRDHQSMRHAVVVDRIPQLLCGCLLAGDVTEEHYFSLMMPC